MLVERYRDVSADIYIYLIGFRKAFDTVNHDKLTNILRNPGMGKCDVGVRQDCVVSTII